MTWIVFSRNRTFQLDACLATMVANGNVDPKDVTVLHRYDADLLPDLDRLRSYHPDITFVEEKVFRDQVLQLVSAATEELSFATDDALVTRPIDRAAIKACLAQERTVMTYSCRLGFNIDYCYPLNVKQPRPPGLTDDLSGTFFYPWKACDHDWSYPLSLDGHFYKRDLLLRLLPRLDFRNPNTMESAMAQSARSRSWPVPCPGPTRLRRRNSQLSRKKRVSMLA